MYVHVSGSKGSKLFYTCLLGSYHQQLASLSAQSSTHSLSVQMSRAMRNYKPCPCTIKFCIVLDDKVSRHDCEISDIDHQQHKKIFTHSSKTPSYKKKSSDFSFDPGHYDNTCTTSNCATTTSCI